MGHFNNLSQILKQLLVAPPQSGACISGGDMGPSAVRIQTAWSLSRTAHEVSPGTWDQKKGVRRVDDPSLQQEDVGSHFPSSPWQKPFQAED
jgi:hypothetical protein